MLDAINGFFKKPLVPFVFRIFTLLLFIALIILGFSAHSEDGSFLKQLRNTNLGGLLVWSYWWPLIVIAAIFFGRIWCTICPAELLTSLSAKIGFKNKRPKWLLSGWGITIFFIVILFIGIRGFAIHRDPTFMAWYLISIIGVSVIVGLIYEKNTFCRYVCPVGHLLGLYSRLSFFGWRVRNPDLCKGCKDKSCINKDHTYNLINKSCGVDLYPAQIDDNTACILCGGCLNTCEKYNPNEVKGRPNPGFKYIGFAKDLYKIKPLLISEFFFLFVVSGFVIYEILSEWILTKKILMFIPDHVGKLFHVQHRVLLGIVESTILFRFFRV